MTLHKDLIELMGYAQHWNDITFIPTQIDADDETCTVKMSLVDLEQEITEVVLQGKHDNFLFDTECSGVKIRINLKTGVMRKLREHRDDE
ncbi:MAG: hypothetical protein IKK22_02585 [Firmicutes bacterium]|nr:hypothetical protein [Bacillota bacterium]MBR7148254.1 hypothetical protein [Bacillota bacterium]